MHKKAIPAPNKNTFQIDSRLFLYHKLVDKAPLSTPNSKAINIVPVPRPRLFLGERSAVQAKIVGEMIPVAIPKIIDEI